MEQFNLFGLTLVQHFISEVPGNREDIAFWIEIEWISLSKDRLGRQESTASFSTGKLRIDDGDDDDDNDIDGDDDWLI